uniref:Uncharacterized protein n=1 Tax=Setaria viridis TaxID=4556 RepID=A0A4U6VPY0_SETVI|nr:hypothetical protein SEVIR_2G134500v2 [Setaria viridis]
MILPSWNNFLQALLRVVVVRSNHDERLMRIILPLELMLISLRLEEEERCKKENEDFAWSSLQRCWLSFFGCLFSAYLLSIFLCGLLYESLYRFEIWSCMTCEYNEDEEQYLIVLKCNFIFFESAMCGMMM